MAKKKTDKPVYELIEEAIRTAVAELPSANALPELDYIQAYMEALDLIQCGLEMRKQELLSEIRNDGRDELDEGY